MNPDLQAAKLEEALAAQRPLIDRMVTWPQVSLRQRTYHFGPELPDQLVSSVRAVVFRGAKVVVVRDRLGPPHVTPGGRRETGESWDETLRRELLEECGWSVAPPKPFAFHHYEYQGERPEGFSYPWRPFLQPIFVAEAVSYDRSGLKRMGEIETGSRLTSFQAALALLPEDQQAILRAAREART